MFEELKRRTVFGVEKRVENVRYMLYFNENRAAIKGVNLSGEEIEYGKYGGSSRILRELDEYFQKVKDETAFVIDWSEEPGAVYIDENERVLKLLKQSDCFVNDKMEKLVYIFPIDRYRRNIFAKKLIIIYCPQRCLL